MNNLELLEKDIEKHSAQVVSAHPELDQIREDLQKFRISRDSDIAPPQYLLEINGVECFPRGDLIAISGKEKCGKTTICRILSTAILRGEYMKIRALQNDLRILWIDTEQAPVSTLKVLLSIDMMCDFEAPDNQIAFFNLREWEDRSTLILALRTLFDDFRPDFVILDGIRDFVFDFNDIRASAEIILECMRLSNGVSAEKAKELKINERKACSIVCILHQNKPKEDSSMRGHLGTELSNKSGEVWEMSRDDDGVFKFTQSRARNSPVSTPVCFKVFSRNYVNGKGETIKIGIPEGWDTMDTNVQSNTITDMIKTRNDGEFPRTTINVQWMFWKVMGNRALPWNKLIREVCDYFGISWKETVSLKNLIPEDLVKDDLDLMWRYKGPSFDDPGGIDETP